MPTRRAPIPGAGAFLIGPNGQPGWGDVEHEHDFFIEVTDTSSPLQIHFFDIDAGNAYDRAVGGFGTPLEVTLFDAELGVYLSETVPKSFETRLRNAGAEVVRAGETYEASMACAERAARRP